MKLENRYIQWVGFLYLLSYEASQGSWLELLECLDEESPQRARFPLVSEKLYFDFAADILNMVVDGHDAEAVNEFAQCAMSTLKLTPPKGYDEALVHCIWSTIHIVIKQHRPRVIKNFGRISIPYYCRPEREEFDQWLQSLTQPEPVKSYDELYLRADAFINSIENDPFDDFELLQFPETSEE